MRTEYLFPQSKYTVTGSAQHFLTHFFSICWYSHSRLICCLVARSLRWCVSLRVVHAHRSTRHWAATAGRTRVHSAQVQWGGARTFPLQPYLQHTEWSPRSQQRCIYCYVHTVRAWASSRVEDTRVAVAWRTDSDTDSKANPLSPWLRLIELHGFVLVKPSTLMQARETEHEPSRLNATLASNEMKGCSWWSSGSSRHVSDNVSEESNSSIFRDVSVTTQKTTRDISTALRTSHLV